MGAPGETTEQLQLEGKYLLTSTGELFAGKRQLPVRDLRLRDGSSGSGFIWKTFPTENVKRFIAYELISRIDVDRAEFLSKRREIMTVARETFGGLLMKRFRPELKHIIRESPVFQSLRERLALVSGKQIQAYLAKHDRAIRVLRHSLLFEPMERINGEPNLDREDRLERIKQVQTIVAGIDGETWFLLSLVPEGRERERLMRTIHDLLLTYVKRFRVGDFVALILMELLEYAERTQLINFAERDQYVRTHPSALASRLADPSFREKMFQRAMQSDSLLNLSFRFVGNPYNVTRTEQVAISVVNKGLVGYESRREILAKRHRNTRRVSLAEFYTHENPSQFDTTLGSFYLSSVAEECNAVGLDFSADITRDESKEETTATIAITM